MNLRDEEHLIATICDHLDYSLELLPAECHAALDTARVKASSLIAGGTDPEISPAINDKLDAIRQQAIDHYQRRLKEQSFWDKLREQFTSVSLFPQPLTAGVFTSLGIAVLFLSMYLSDSQNSSISIEQEILMVASADDLELYENLEFYIWLAENGLPN